MRRERKRRREGECDPPRRAYGGNLRSNSIASLVSAYLKLKAKCVDDLGYYRKAKSWTELIRRAAMAERLNAQGERKRHNHQRRIPRASLAEATTRLQKADFQSVKDFDTLHDLVADVVAGIPKFKELTIYDTAHRIGAGMKPRVRPKFVYLHAGTWKGAKALLGLKRRVPNLPLSAFPPAMHRLRPEQAEDFLCIFKDKLACVL